LKDDNFELLSFAQDTGGEEAAGEFYDKAEATYTTVIDERHLISTLFNMTNVPSGVWINEEGMIVRPPETAYSKATELKLSGRVLSSDGDAYVNALRDWVKKGADSEFVLSPEEVTGKLAPRTNEQAQAEAYFQLATHFQSTGDMERAEIYWAKSQELRPESWNYHRQDWSFTPKEAGAKWMQKFVSMDENDEYYPALDLPKSE
jgi:hypothetical protein